MDNEKINKIYTKFAVNMNLVASDIFSSVMNNEEINQKEIIEYIEMALKVLKKNYNQNEVE